MTSLTGTRPQILSILGSFLRTKLQEENLTAGNRRRGSQNGRKSLSIQVLNWLSLPSRICLQLKSKPKKNIFYEK